PGIYKVKGSVLAKKRELVEEYAKKNRFSSSKMFDRSRRGLSCLKPNSLATTTLKCLQRTIWWTLSLHFGFRARDESRRIEVGDVAVDKDRESGGEVLGVES
ncbi:hypothetical protein OS493_040020, partial [Desmophyllum pertusum]